MNVSVQNQNLLTSQEAIMCKSVTQLHVCLFNCSFAITPGLIWGELQGKNQGLQSTPAADS